MIERAAARRALEVAMDHKAVAVLLGPRQCGKTTLARECAVVRPSVFLDLERASDRAKLRNPELFLGGLGGGW